jgi:hypothetical protein
MVLRDERTRTEMLDSMVYAYTGKRLAEHEIAQILKSLDGAHDVVCNVTQIITKEMWTDDGADGYLVALNDKMKATLARDSMAQGLIPTELPRRYVRYLRWQYGNKEEVPESSNAWDLVEVELRMNARTP